MQNISLTKLITTGIITLVLITSTCWARGGDGFHGVNRNDLPVVNNNNNNVNINVDRNFDGTYPYGSYPAGSYPAGSYPAGSYPAGSYPYNSDNGITIDRSNIHNFDNGERNSN